MENMNKSINRLSVLCLEDILNDVHLINEILSNAGYQVSMDIASDEKEYLSFLQGNSYGRIPGYVFPKVSKRRYLNFSNRQMLPIPDSLKV